MWLPTDSDGIEVAMKLPIAAYATDTCITGWSAGNARVNAPGTYIKKAVLHVCCKPEVTAFCSELLSHHCK